MGFSDILVVSRGFWLPQIQYNILKEGLAPRSTQSLTGAWFADLVCFPTAWLMPRCGTGSLVSKEVYLLLSQEVVRIIVAGEVYRLSSLLLCSHTVVP